jgi:hypothetical protein
MVRPPPAARSYTGRERRTRCPSAGPAAPWGSSDPWSAIGTAARRSSLSGHGCGSWPVCACAPATSNYTCSSGGEGWRVNHERVYRPYTEEGLALRRRRPRRHRSAVARVRLPAPTQPNEQW